MLLYFILPLRVLNEYINSSALFFLPTNKQLWNEFKFQWIHSGLESMHVSERVDTPRNMHITYIYTHIYTCVCVVGRIQITSVLITYTNSHINSFKDHPIFVIYDFY